MWENIHPWSPFLSQAQLLPSGQPLQSRAESWVETWEMSSINSSQETPHSSSPPIPALKILHNLYSGRISVVKIVNNLHSYEWSLLEVSSEQELPLISMWKHESWNPCSIISFVFLIFFEDLSLPRKIKLPEHSGQFDDCDVWCVNSLLWRW